MEDFDAFEKESDSTVQLTEIMKEHLTESAKWTKFMAIVGFSLFGLMCVAFLVFAGVVTFYAENFPGMNGFAGAQFVLLFFGIIFYGSIIFLPSWHMFQFASNLLKGIPTMDVSRIESAFLNLKSLFKFYAIFMIVILSIYAILLVALGLTQIL